MSLRLRSLKQLGQGAWKIAQSFGGQEGAISKRRRTGTNPQEVLYALVCSKFPDAVGNMTGGVPGRKYEIDIALTEIKLAIEVDGWEFHGKYKKGFLRDRQKDRALLLSGWRTLRFTAGEILGDSGKVLETIVEAAEMIGPDKGADQDGG